MIHTFLCWRGHLTSEDVALTLPICCPQIESSQAHPNREQVCGRLAFAIGVTKAMAAFLIADKKSREREITKLILTRKPI